MTGKVWYGVLFLCLMAGPAFGLQAYARITEEPFYTQYKAEKWPGASLTKGYAPFPVFLEGHFSTPRADIVDYIWNFGDGSPTFNGFNAAHVYEKPGTYTAQLTVVDKNGATSSATVKITVLQPDGITYYVDSETGNDAHSGKSTSDAWRTATFAFRGIAASRYRPGDRILFKRGQTFEVEGGLIAPGSWYAKHGYSFATYGSGPKPIIQKVGASTAPIIKIGMRGLAHFAIVDLEFRLYSPEGIPSGEVCAVMAEAFNLLFLRVDVNGCDRALGFSGDYGTRRMSGIFVVDCNFYNSADTTIFARCSRFAVLDSAFDLSGDHIIYSSWLDKGLYAGNSFSRPAFGRVCLRVSGSATYDNPTNNVLLTNNHFEGWIDPKSDKYAHNGGGVRYNYVLVDIGPNGPRVQAINQCEVKNNVFKDAETLLYMGCVDDLKVHDNYFDTVDANAHAHRLLIGHTYEWRPSQNVYIYDNTIVSNEARVRWPSVIGIRQYDSYEYNGLTYHKNINIHNNKIEMVNSNGAAAIWIQDPDPVQINQVHSNDNTYYTPYPTQMFVCGSSYYSGPGLTLPQWRTKTGEDTRSVIGGAVMPKEGEPTDPTDPTDPAPNAPTYRINVGGSAYKDSSGNAWTVDTGFVNGGSVYKTSKAIGGTSADALYQDERYASSDLAFGFPVSNGSYKVRLHFAEIYAGTARVGARVFDVAAEGKTMIDNLDIFAGAGYLNALTREFTVNVADEQLNLLFRRQVQNPKVNAIEILPATDAEPTPAAVAYRFTAGGNTYTDGSGNVWEAGAQYASPGSTYSTSKDISGTNFVPLYQIEYYASGALAYSIPVENGDYRVRLHFAEIYGGAARVGGRVFDVALEDQTVLNNFDIYARAGYLAADVEEFDATVSDGQLDIELLRVVQNPKINGIEIIPLQPA